MGRMHTPGKGPSQSALSYCCHGIPTQLKWTSDDDEKEQIYQLAQKGKLRSGICLQVRA
uniref:Small ribosomal subunit protein uS15 N-terminal domain-containing protein n=2 Tax=Canis lupus familiaris TaxID=9615 RepID=A0A8P0PEJ5_CANLF